MSFKRVRVLVSLASCSLPLLTLPAFAQAARPRTPVTQAMVLSAFAAKHIPIDGVNVRLSSPITAAGQQPVLQVDAIAAIAPHVAQLRMACANRGDCLPFFVTVTFPDPVDVAALATDTNRAGKEAQAKNTKPATGNAAEQKTPAMNAGVNAVLLIEDTRVHVSIHVIALENGATGDLIHVATPDHKQRFVASVVDAGSLKGHF